MLIKEAILGVNSTVNKQKAISSESYVIIGAEET